MTQEELMLHDFVRCKADGSVVQIKTHWDIYSAKDFDPVPITPEILKKNGFEVDMYSTLQLGNGKWLEYYHHEHRLRVWWKGIDEWDNHSEVTELVSQCHVWYVHELQHALRLCKIDKEIRL